VQKRLTQMRLSLHLSFNLNLSLHLNLHLNFTALLGPTFPIQAAEMDGFRQMLD
jgi:hypothetical protein